MSAPSTSSQQTSSASAAPQPTRTGSILRPELSLKYTSGGIMGILKDEEVPISQPRLGYLALTEKDEGVVVFCYPQETVKSSLMSFPDRSVTVKFGGKDQEELVTGYDAPDEWKERGISFIEVTLDKKSKNVLEGYQLSMVSPGDMKLFREEGWSAVVVSFYGEGESRGSVVQGTDGSNAE